MARPLTRGSIWTVAGGPDYTGKPRPAVVLQDDYFTETASVTVCPFTSVHVNAPLLRLAIEPSVRNGLRKPSYLMVEKITTVSKQKLQSFVGHLSPTDLRKLNRAVIVFLGLSRSGLEIEPE